ncbi:MAG: THUMP domain-containing protein [Bacteroidales bacterium]|nr:THUMP domain-containing protein [Bacteroidales bacterium]
MKEEFEMVAKTLQGLEDVLAEELRDLGAKNVEPGRRMVSFQGDLEMLYRANLQCRTALRILKPIYKFEAHDPDELYAKLKEVDWNTILTLDKTFAVDVTAYSDEFTHSRYVTYRVKDAIVDWFKDRFGPDARPKVRTTGGDVLINVHIAGDRITISLDSSGESLHKRGYRVAQTEAPINEVLAAGIILKSGWRGDSPFVDPMCGSGTFLIEAAMIAAGIAPGVYRKNFAFEQWKDFDPELLDRLYNDDSMEREVTCPILGADISPRAIAIAQENIKSAGVNKYIDLQVKPIQRWEEAPANGVLITNPPYGERISVEDMDGLYATLGTKLKNVFKGYHAWIIGYHEEYFQKIGLAPSQKIPMYNGALECELREYIIFDGDYKTFRANGGRIKEIDEQQERREARKEGPRASGERPFKSRDRDKTPFRDRDKKPFRDKKSSRPSRDDRNKPGERSRLSPRGPLRDEPRRSGPRNPLEEEYRPKTGRFSRAIPVKDPEPESDNPLAKRRNINALKSIQGKQPSLPANPDAAHAPTMRSRRGWRKPPEAGETK